MEKITFIDPETNEEVLLYVIEETKLNGESYILATEEEEGDSDAYILHQLEDLDNEGDFLYEFVEEDALLDALSTIFGELLEDGDFSR